jgi:hypothetical protein
LNKKKKNKVRGICGDIKNYLKEAAPLGSLHAAEVNSDSGSGQNYKRRFSNFGQIVIK